MMLYGRGLDQARVSSTSGTGGLSQYQEQLEFEDEPVTYRAPRSRLSRSIGLVLFLLVLGGAAFGGTYLYSSPELQQRLGVKPFFDKLPWKHEELLAKARENPLEFSSMTLALSTREGNALAPPQSQFKDTDLTNARYLKWTASFKNLLAGLEGRSEKIEARFYDPNGLQIASSDTNAFVGPAQTTADFTGVALMPTMTDKPPGTYKVALYSDDKMLSQESFIVKQDLGAKNAEAESAAAAAAAAKEEERKRDEEARKLAMIDERRAKPLQLRSINFLNTTKTGTALSGATNSFAVSKVLFIGWQVNFENRLYKLEPGQYRVDAAYIGPDGRTLGSVNDFQPVSTNMKSVTFSGRVGNSRGGAFLPGTYTVNFYLNGQYFDAKKFEVVADTGTSPYAGYGGGGGGAIGSTMGTSSTSSGSMVGPMIATGTISGLRSGGNPGDGASAAATIKRLPAWRARDPPVGLRDDSARRIRARQPAAIPGPIRYRDVLFRRLAPGRSDQRHLRINAVRRTWHLDHPDELTTWTCSKRREFRRRNRRSSQPRIAPRWRAWRSRKASFTICAHSSWDWSVVPRSRTTSATAISFSRSSNGRFPVPGWR